MSVQATAGAGKGIPPSASVSWPLIPEYDANTRAHSLDLLLQAVSRRPISQTRDSMAIAIHAARDYKRLTPTEQHSVRQIGTSLLNVSHDDIERDPEFWRPLLNPFLGALQTAEVPTQAPPPAQAAAEPASILVEGEFPQKQKAPLTDAEAAALTSVRARQTRLICKFAHLFLEHYVLPSMSKDPDDDKRFLLQFDQIFPALVDSYFFKEPEGLTRKIKDLMLNIFRSLKTRLADYNLTASSSKLRKNHQPLPTPPPPAAAADEPPADTEQTTLLVSGFVMMLPSPKATRPAHPKNLRENLEDIIQQLMANPKDPADQFASLFLSKFLIQGLEFLSSPYFLCLFFERILQDTFKLAEAPKEHIPDDLCAPRDKAFSKQVGVLLKEITGEVIKMGRPKGPMKRILSFAKLIIDSKSADIGAQVQTGMSRLFNSECVIMPILILDGLLFKEENGKKVPTMLGTLGKTEGQMQAYQAAIEAKMEKQFYDTVKRLVKQYAPGGFLAMRAVNAVESLAHSLNITFSKKEEAEAEQETNKSIEAFCHHLIQSLYKFAQTEMVPVVLSIADALRNSDTGAKK